MSTADIEELCERGQSQLMAMEYLAAEATLADVARQAESTVDFDLLSRVMLPLQEARRQRRQRCGEGTVSLDLLANGPDDLLDARRIVEEIPKGQLLVAGWGTLEPALEVRRLQREQGLYVETFLAAVYLTEAGRAIVIAPSEDTKLPPPAPRSWDALASELPRRCLMLRQLDLPAGRQTGTAETYGRIMDLWEKLHSPFLADGNGTLDLHEKITRYETTISVDYACELAHQGIAEAARRLAKMLN
ncbi:MAG: hypothetical protein ABSH22_07140 [Tepidisphaeraceae bacterium]